MVNILPKRGPKAFDTLISVLQSVNEYTIADLLLQSVERRKGM